MRSQADTTRAMGLLSRSAAKDGPKGAHPAKGVSPDDAVAAAGDGSGEAAAAPPPLDACAEAALAKLMRRVVIPFTAIAIINHLDRSK